MKSTYRSPYEGVPIEEWSSVTQRLVNEHPLSPDVITEIALETWRRLWKTRLGDGESILLLSDLQVPATVVGYFFERLFAKALSDRYPDVWRGQSAKDEKDLVCITDRAFDTEIKSSGQLGDKIYGNRSYGKKGVDEALESKPEKSGYYITVNFHGQTLHLLRFGWIDFDDWEPQKAETGQAARLLDRAYRHKLIELPGDYQLEGSVALLPKVGPRRCAFLAAQGISTIRQLLDYQGQNPAISSMKLEAEARYPRTTGAGAAPGSATQTATSQQAFPGLGD
jgi:hypothetical protein